MFFAYGQTIPTIRGAGIHQLGMEIALQRLRENRWVHVFPEGKVNQDDSLLRLKWGVGRLIMESDRVPIVVPMFHHWNEGGHAAAAEGTTAVPESHEERLLSQDWRCCRFHPAG
ncbi:hypothetical protein DL89DRAFT_259590 [Linderina pennispora]|uniref:Tafazzin family protein n=1 Tax=Linderina pennispora TaxID=61395 RepID=A0A1Y1W0L8_9FUNG|nr:uncharacterized protein DL89DRAFT_259590 [Linderina pennispora]ORX67053.1 hypothetical protein DL89DRAFT_259590 [Linderina pennispora]